MLLYFSNINGAKKKKDSYLKKKTLKLSAVDIWLFNIQIINAGTMEKKTRIIWNSLLLTFSLGILHNSPSF